jgi:hypothetical protein
MNIRQLSLGKHVDVVKLGLILFGQNVIIIIFSNLGSRGQLRNVASGEKLKMWRIFKVFDDLFTHYNLI